MKKFILRFSFLFSFLFGGVFAFGQTTTFNYVAPGGGVTTYAYTGGLQNYTVPAGVTSIDIESWGAQGGSEPGGNIGGYGARMKGTFAVTPGHVLQILVGGAGGGPGTYSGSGGGGSFVYNASTGTLLMAAGGGGGASASGYGSSANTNAVTTTSGLAGTQPGAGAGGTGSAGGGQGIYSGGGAGWGSNGGSSGYGQGGYTFGGGGSGGNGYGGGSMGGYGGGGGDYAGGGGGGGYSGGGAGGWSYGWGGGGGSYNAGASQSNTGGVQAGNGQVNITAPPTGVQTYTVPAGVTSLTIESYGAQGGNSTGYGPAGGLGARMKGTFVVTPGQVLKVLVGGAGVGGYYSGGGGGGSFVTDISNNPLCIAGGGSGGNGPSSIAGNPGLTTTAGGNSSCCSGGSAGGGGGASAGTRGGGGLTGNGAASGCASNAGMSFTNGGAGGAGYGSTGSGGYGGGSGGEWVCQGAGGAGGGYSGGAGANAGGVGAGAGGSYNGGTNQSNSGGVRSGNGVVYITLPAPYQSSWISMNTGSASWCAGEVRTVSVVVKNIGTSTWTDAGVDVNIGCTWSSNGTYPYRVNAGNLAPGSQATYSFTVTAPGASSDYLVFDVVKEGDCWFAGNAGSCGPGNLNYSTAVQTISCCTPSTPVSLAGTATGQTTANLSWAAGATVGSPTVTYSWFVGTNPAGACGTTTNTYNYSGAIQNWTVPAGVTSIDVEAYGAQGGNDVCGTTGGLGARMKGTFAVTPGQTIRILAGQQGSNCAYACNRGGGGGGGSFVYNLSSATLLIAAGGGGGAGQSGYSGGISDGVVGTSGMNGTVSGGAGGAGGAGGGASMYCGGGAGWSTNGTGSGYGGGGTTFSGGGAGGAAYSDGGSGGFGGGGGSYAGSGGGGGYSGGGAGGWSYSGWGGGGGSYNAGTGQSNTGAVRSGNGVVTITYNTSTSIASGTTTGTTASVTGLTCGTTYYLTVYATTSCNSSSSACVTASFASGACCVAPSISVQPASQTKCVGTAVTFAVTASGTGLTYQWRKNGTNIGGATSNSYNIASVVGGDAASAPGYDVVITGTCGNVTSSAATLTINTASALGTISNAGPIDFCNSGGDWTAAGPISVSGHNGTITWDWGSSNGTWNNGWTTGTQPGYCCFPKKVAASDANADRIRWSVTNGVCPATAYSSTILLQNHYNEAPSSLSSSINNICSSTAGTLTATFPTATNITGTVNFYSGSCGGTLVASVAGNGTTSVATAFTAPAATTNYYVRYSPGSGSGCSNSACANTTVTYWPTAAPSVSIGSSPSGAICSGTSVVFTATPTNGGAGPAYQWKKNGGNVGSNSATYTDAGLANGDVITCVMTSNYACLSSNPATSNAINMNVNATPTTVTVSGGGTYCVTSSTTLTASGGVGGTIYWQNTTSGGTSTATPSSSEVVSANGTYYFRAESPAGCWSNQGSATVAFDVAPVQGGVSNAGPIDFCSATGDWSAEAISVAGTFGTVWWQFGASNGTWSGDWVSGLSPAYTVFPKKVAASDGNPDRVRWYVKNGVCPPTAYSSAILIRNHNNENPTGVSSNINNICSGTAGTLTATFPTATNILGTVEFATSCAGAPIATVSGNGTTSVSTPFTAPATTTTYYVRYNPGTGTGCSPGSCVNTTVTILAPAPATPGVITGTVAHCPNVTGKIYSIAAVANATTYTWAVPTGWSITAGNGTTVITVTVGNFGQNGNITVTAGNSCGTSAAATLAVNTNGCLPTPTQLAFPTTANCYVTLTGGANLVIGNSATNAIINSGTSGGFKRWIISEGQSNSIRWNNTNTGTYVIPFGYSNSAYIPFTFNKTSAGTSDLTVSTWGTPSSNAPWAAVTNVGAVTNMWSSAINQDGSIPSVIDRWWTISTTATADMTFSYRAAESLTTTFPTAAFRAQHWNGTTWDAPVGTGTVVASGVGTVTVPNASTFSPWILSADGAPLPVTWLDFSAECNSGDVTIKWSTASEQNADYFTVERSLDGTNFTDLTVVLASGNSNTVKNYSAVDADPYAGTSVYRIRETDFNGSFMHSGLMTVNACSNDDISIFGNGSNVMVTINAEEEGSYRFEIYDVLGQRLMNEAKNVSAGSNHFKLSPTNVSSAIYIVKVYNNNNTVTKKIFIRSTE